MEKLSERLLALKNDEGGLTLSFQELCQRFPEQNTALFIIFLSLPSALPVPAPGYSTPFGLLLSWIGLRFLKGEKRMFLPQKFKNKRFSLSRRVFSACIKLIQWIEIFVRPNRSPLFFKFFSTRFVGINLCLLSLIMALPIPLTNTAPAGIILLFGVGLLEQDGFLLGCTQILSLILVSCYVAAFIWILCFGLESFQRLLPWLF